MLKEVNICYHLQNKTSISDLDLGRTTFVKRSYINLTFAHSYIWFPISLTIVNTDIFFLHI